MTKQDVLERFMSKVEITNGCWIWTGGVNDSGYGTFSLDPGAKRYAHRWIYETVVELIPVGLTIDHLINLNCTTKLCVHPDHLEVVTRAENLRRAGARIAVCKNGHEFTPENTYIRKEGRRVCRACKLERWRAENPGRPQFKIIKRVSDQIKKEPGNT